VNIGAQIDDSTVITTLDDLAEVDVDFSVPEIFFGTIRAGQPVKATSAAYGDRIFEGVIDTVDSRIDRVSRSFKVRARIPNADLALPAGMFMAVELELAEREALTVPEEAIMVDGDDIAVFVIIDDKAERRAVTLGQRDFGLVEIKEGLREGEQVVVKGIQRVRAGKPVSVTRERNDAESQKKTPSPAATTAAGA
jgi:membrane fusion protein (multidrug efflux system)